MPRPSAAAMALTGAGQAGDLISDMMTVEKTLTRIIRRIPALAGAAQPFIDQMRDLGAAALADQAGGGIGTTTGLDASVPPPGAMGPGGMGAGPGIMPPMPMI